MRVIAGEAPAHAASDERTRRLQNRLARALASRPHEDPLPVNEPGHAPSQAHAGSPSTQPCPGDAPTQPHPDSDAPTQPYVADSPTQPSSRAAFDGPTQPYVSPRPAPRPMQQKHKKGDITPRQQRHLLQFGELDTNSHMQPPRGAKMVACMRATHLARATIIGWYRRRNQYRTDRLRPAREMLAYLDRRGGLHFDMPSVWKEVLADEQVVLLRHKLVPSVWFTTPKNSTQDMSGEGPLLRSAASGSGVHQGPMSCVPVPMHVRFFFAVTTPRSRPRTCAQTPFLAASRSAKNSTSRRRCARCCGRPFPSRDKSSLHT